MSKVIDKSGWGDGPWATELDNDQWRDEATGLQCMIKRGPMGALCGYVGLPVGHPLAGLGYHVESPKLAQLLERRKEKPMGEHPSMAVMLACLGGELDARPDVVFNVHGGLTYSGTWEGDLWWFGFDCGHCDDLTPGISFGLGWDRGEYRDWAYVKAEVEKLAVQLAEVGK